MSWGGVSANLLIDYMRSKGVMYQQDLDLPDPLWIFVDSEFLESVPYGVSYVRGSNKGGFYGTEDHPRFRDARNFLEKEGYIKVERSWSNGDRVLKPFFFNNVLLKTGDAFYCACAMRYSFSTNYNDGQPDLEKCMKEFSEVLNDF